MSGGGASPGWYPDPDGSGRQRWWDGLQWSDHYQAPPAPVAAPAPAVAPAPVYQPQSPAPMAPMGGAPIGPPPPARTGGSGTKVLLWILAILGVLIVLGIGGCVVAGVVLTNKVGNALEDKDYGTVGMREPVKVRGTTYEALDARTATSIGSTVNTTNSATASGKFVIVTVRLFNNGSRTGLVSGTDLSLETRAGRRYLPDSQAQIASPNPLIFESLRGGETRTGTLTYDVPKSDVVGSRLRVQALLGNGHAYIRLNLG